MAMEKDPLYKVIITTATRPADDRYEEGSLQRRLCPLPNVLEMVAMKSDPLYKMITTRAKRPSDDSNEEGSLV